MRRWAGKTVERLGARWDAFGVLLCGPVTMRRYQSRFRGRSDVTDVLSFPGEGAYLGDVVICVDRVREQASHAGIPFESELMTVLVHGILHCAGYDHECDDGEMLELQAGIIRSIA